MTVVVLGIDALDPELVDPGEHPNLVLEAHGPIDTIASSVGSPSTHELWPTIITGLTPDEHGLTLDEGVAWESPWLRIGSGVAGVLLPSTVQTWIGAWLLNNTAQDAFRATASYYRERGIDTVFDGRAALSIGVPNYVVDPDSEDREHRLRRSMGELFERDPAADTGHSSAEPAELYEQCLEMSMIRIARVRRAVRGHRYELVFGYTSGLDLIGHVAHDNPGMQAEAYDELDDFVGELRGDIGVGDELVLVSDHGLQDGLHTETAMIAATAPWLLEDVASVLDVRSAIEKALLSGDHAPTGGQFDETVEREGGREEHVREHLEDLGYL